MDRIDKVEKLREKTGVSYEDAKAALEKSEWDLLDAIVLLEKEGKVKEAAYSTKQEEPPKSESKAEPEGNPKGDGFDRFASFLGRMFHKGNTNHLNIIQNGEQKLRMPITVFVLLLLILPLTPFIIGLMILGLFFGFRYRFTGADLGKNGGINKVMDQAAKAATTVKEEFNKEESENKGDKENKDE